MCRIGQTLGTPPAKPGAYLMLSYRRLVFG